MDEQVLHAEGHEVDAELAALIASSEAQVEVQEVEVQEDQLPGIREVISMLRAERDQKASIEETLTECNKRIAKLEATAADLLRAAGVENMRFAGIGTAYISVSPKPRVKDPEKFLEWAKEHMPETVKEAVHPSTLASAIKQRLENGEVLPEPDVMDVFYATGVRLRRS